MQWHPVPVMWRSNFLITIHQVSMYSPATWGGIDIHIWNQHIEQRHLGCLHIKIQQASPVCNLSPFAVSPFKPIKGVGLIHDLLSCRQCQIAIVVLIPRLQRQGEATWKTKSWINSPAKIRYMLLPLSTLENRKGCTLQTLKDEFSEFQYLKRKLITSIMSQKRVH